MEQLNFILVTIDCLRPDHLSCYGYERTTSPSIDRLAGAGVRFEQAIANGGWTQPGLVALLTSTYGLMYDGCRKFLSVERPSLPEELGRLGYLTAGFTSNPQVGKTFGYDRGFGLFEDVEPHRTSPWWSKVRGVPRLLRHPFPHRLLSVLQMRALPSAVACDARTITEVFCHWLEMTQSPFFAWIHYMDTHFPYIVDENLCTPQELAGAWRKLKSLYDSAELGYSKHPGQEIMSLVTSDYDQAIVYVDAQIGVMVQQLEDMGMADSTVIILTADHGEQFFEHGRWSHNRLYDEVIRVPLIITIPKGGIPSCFSEQVTHLDIAPTLLDIIEEPKVPGMLGQSLKPALFGTDGYESGYVISEMVMGEGTHQVAVRTERYKYIYHMAAPVNCELYDLELDPHEQRNIAAESPDLVLRFKDLVTQHMEAVQETQGQGQCETDVSEQVLQRLRALGYLE